MSAYVRFNTIHQPVFKSISLSPERQGPVGQRQGAARHHLFAACCTPTRSSVVVRICYVVDKCGCSGIDDVREGNHDRSVQRTFSWSNIAIDRELRLRPGKIVTTLLACKAIGVPLWMISTVAFPSSMQERRRNPHLIAHKRRVVSYPVGPRECTTRPCSSHLYQPTLKREVGPGTFRVSL